MSGVPKTAAVTVRVLDKDYQVACPEDQREALLASARLVDEKMRDIRDSRKMMGIDQVAVMAALNMAHDLLQAESSDVAEGMGEKFRNLQNKVDVAIRRGRQMEL
ncbi:MAG: cell division protein ZapA [Gammaproteobacteria bacterium]|nr:cell division protein ZapA [Gammaproteobacteria bacterium]